MRIGISFSKYRNIDIDTLKEKYALLQKLKNLLGQKSDYKKLISAMSQIIANLERTDAVLKKEKTETWSNLSERGMNKVIPPVRKRDNQKLAVEWTDKWGNTCNISKGYWGAKNYRVMDAIHHMFVLKEGNDRLPQNAEPIFNDLGEIQQREHQLNGSHGNILPAATNHYVRFTDDDFKKFTGFNLSSTEIKKLLLDTSRVEFKLTFPVRLKCTESKEKMHHMSYYSRFFELGYENLSVKSNGVVLSRRYHISFNTLLGELTVNNLLAKFNDRISIRLFLLPNSAQIFYRRALSHQNYRKNEYRLPTIAEYVDLVDKNLRNLARTVETNILTPLVEHKWIDSYEKVGDDPKSYKYIVRRSGPGISENTRDEAGSVKDEAGSVKAKNR